MHHTAGVILCGGRSSRMGRPKAWLPVGPETMLGRVVRLLGEVAFPLVVVAGPDQNVPSRPAEVEIVRDPVADRGPLQGLAAGLRALEGRAEVAFVSSCDAPLLRPAFVRRLVELLGDHDVCLPDVAGRLHPLAAVYRVRLAHKAEQLLAAGRSRMRDVLESVRVRVPNEADLLEADPTLGSLRNVNTQEDYDALLRELL